jgi:putative oxidoreductase
MKKFAQLLSLLFGGVFVYAGVVKALDPTAFLMDVRSFQMLPDPYAAWLALALPWLEIIAGLAVITGVLRKGGLLLLNAALILFFIAITIAWSRGLDIRCGCFGSSDTTTSYIELYVRDLLLLAVGGWLLFRNIKDSKQRVA